MKGNQEYRQGYPHFFERAQEKYESLDEVLEEVKRGTGDRREIVRKKMNIPDSVVPGDFPPRIWKEFAVELCEPVARLANDILRKGEWPES